MRQSTQINMIAKFKLKKKISRKVKRINVCHVKRIKAIRHSIQLFSSYGLIFDLPTNLFECSRM